MDQRVYLDASDASVSVRELQTLLRTAARCQRGSVTLASDGIFGKETEEALRRFQQSENLPATGQVDLMTWNALVRAAAECADARCPGAALCPVSDAAVLSAPDRDPDFVFFLQAVLHSLGNICRFPEPVVFSGVYDRATASAVAAVQSLFGETPTGALTPAVWNNLVSFCNTECAKRQAALFAERTSESGS